MSKLILKKITLVAVSSIKIEETVSALLRSMQGIDYYDVILISHERPDNLPAGINFKKCSQMKSIEDYNNFMIYNLADYIDSDFVLVVQYDGYVLRPEKWNDIFLNYDYIGAPWRKGAYFSSDGINIRVGNGGFSLRSKKLLKIFNDFKINFVNKNINNYNEDGVICVYCRKELESFGIKFAPVSIASMFSREEYLKDSVLDSFGFHCYKSDFNSKFKNVIKKLLNVLNIKFHRKIKKHYENINNNTNVQ